jgi:hypothetical protein
MVFSRQTAIESGHGMRKNVNQRRDAYSSFLFPMLREEVGPLTGQHERFVTVLDVARIEDLCADVPRQAAG